MIIKISDNLKKQEIWANGMELSNIMGMDFLEGKRVFDYPIDQKKFVCSFKNPILMTDNYKISKLNSTLRDTLFSLFQCKPRIIEYDSVSTIWDSSHIGVWCPSIDTIFFAKNLKNFFKNKNFKTGIEIGVGSGFLTKYCLAKCSSFKQFYAVDINPYAIKSVKDNVGDKRLKTHLGDAIKFMEGKKFDFIITNPPYVPRPGSIDDNPYEGVNLLRHLVHEGQKYLNDGGIMLINLSSLSEKLVFDNRPKMKFKLLDKMDVPLKVNNILNNPSWVSYLKKNAGLKRRFLSGYKYWQELKILEFRN